MSDEVKVYISESSFHELVPVAEQMKIIVREVKRECPVDTGRLRASVHSEGDVLVVDAKNNQGQGYAKFVNDGTRFHAPNPFVQRGINAALPEIMMLRVMRGK